jgi:hypothetical protein
MHKVKRLILTLSLVMLIALVGILPTVYAAAPTYINVADTYTVNGSLNAQYLDGTSHPVVLPATLIIGSDTSATSGVISSASIIINGSTIALTGLVGYGTKPYISLKGTDSKGITITVNGKVTAVGETIKKISGRIDGFITSEGENGAGWGGGGTGVFSLAQANSGSYSSKLDATSALQYVEFTNPKNTMKLSDTEALVAGKLSFYYYLSATPGPQIGLRFTSANGIGHVDVTVMLQSAASIGAWTKYDVTSASTRCVFYGNDDTDGTGFAWNEVSVLTLADCLDLITAKNTSTTTCVTNPATWKLTDVLIDLYEVSARTCYVDNVKIGSYTYTLEPITISGGFTAKP